MAYFDALLVTKGSGHEAFPVAGSFEQINAQASLDPVIPIATTLPIGDSKKKRTLFSLSQCRILLDFLIECLNIGPLSSTHSFRQMALRLEIKWNNCMRYITCRTLQITWMIAIELTWSIRTIYCTESRCQNVGSTGTLMPYVTAASSWSGMCSTEFNQREWISTCGISAVRRASWVVERWLPRTGLSFLL